MRDEKYGQHDPSTEQFSRKGFAESDNSPESKERKEKEPFKRIEFGYCRPFPDVDQITAYCIKRYAGEIEDGAEVDFNFSRSDEESLHDGTVLKLEATYDPNAINPDEGSIGHQMIGEGDQQREVCASYVTYLDSMNNLRETHPDTYQRIEEMAEYVQALDLERHKLPNGVQQPTVSTLYNALFLSHFEHAATGVPETDFDTALEECYRLFAQIIESDNQDIWGTITVEENETIQKALQISEVQRNHDRELMKSKRPEVVALPTGVNIGTIDVRDLDTILDIGAFGQAYRYSDERSGHKSSIAIVIGNERNAQGDPNGTKVLVGVNNRNQIVRELGIDLSRFQTEWNNREINAGVGEQVEPGINWVDGHRADPNNPEAMTLIASPTETGTGLDPYELQQMIEEYFSVERFSEEEMQEIARALGHAYTTTELVPGEYPNTNLRERAIVGCSRFTGRPIPEGHSCEGCRFAIRESDIRVERDEEGNIERSRMLTSEEKQAQSYQLFERYTHESPRKAVFELAKGYIDIEAYRDQPELLLELVDGIAENPHIIEQLYDPDNQILDPPEENLLPWVRSQSPEDQRRSINLTKFNNPESVPHMIDRTVIPILYEHAMYSNNPETQAQVLHALENIRSSEAYQTAVANNEFHDQLHENLLHIALNIDHPTTTTQTSEQLSQYLEVTIDEKVQRHAQEIIRNNLSTQERHHLVEYILNTTVDNETLREHALAFADPEGNVRETLQTREPLQRIEHYHNRPNYEHLAFVLGRQQTPEGEDILAAMEAQIGLTDEAIRSPQIREEDMLAAARQIVQALDQAAVRLSQRLGDEEEGTVDVTFQGTQELNGIVWARIRDLEQEHPNIDFKPHKWIAGKYEPTIRYEDVLQSL